MKVGDRVRVVEDIIESNLDRVRHVGVLTEIQKHGPYDHVVVFPDGVELCWNQFELELAEDDDICRPQETGCGGMCSGCE